MPHHDTHGSIQEPAEAFEERYSGGFYCINQCLDDDKIKEFSVFEDYQDCLSFGKDLANKYQVRVAIMGRLHNGNSELIETIKPSEVSDND